MKEKLSLTDLQSILESLLFTLGRPLSLQELSQALKVEQVPTKKIKQALSLLRAQYQESHRGMELKEVAGGWQIRTKEENKDYIRRMIKGRLFQLSAPALEVLAIVAYRQPCKKMNIDEVRGVESGHLLKTLMEKGLVCFGSRSQDPGRPLTYKTTPRFLEVFDLKSLKDLPDLNDIQDLLSSEIESQNEGLETLLNHVKDPLKASQGQKRITQELKMVSEEINAIKPIRHSAPFLKKPVASPPQESDKKSL